jgi:DNA-binding XRE family transcriptional regulator
MYKPPSEILESVINSLEISKYKFAKEIGLSSPDHLYKMLNGNQKPNWETLRKIIERFPHLNDRFLLRGEGEVQGNSDATNHTSVDADMPAKIDNNSNSITSQSIAQIQLTERDELIKQLRDENAFLRSLIKK